MSPSTAPGRTATIEAGARHDEDQVATVVQLASLQRARTELHDLHRQIGASLALFTRRYGEQYRDALRGGWAAAELERLGCPHPGDARPQQRVEQDRRRDRQR